MSKLGRAPQLFGAVSAKTHTPLVSTLMVLVLVWALAIWFPTAELAALTSFVTLFIFASVNVALWKIKRNKDKPEAAFQCASGVPIVGALLCIALILVHLL
ncbi:MAG: hypothetical protein AAF420_12350 [Pseudomonadota bacterium]